MKRLLLLLIVLSIGTTINAQETKSQPETKMDIFLSKTGVVRKFIDYNLTPLKSTYENTETRVRRFIIDS